jgi:geranylgeranyl reductase family protein
MSKNSFDVIIIGAGPAGCACAMMLADSGLRIAVIDKDKSPKEKICGDGLSKDVINQIEIFPPIVKSSFEKISRKLFSSGIRFYSPDNNCLEISFERESKSVSGYTCERRAFDEMLVNCVKTFSTIELHEGCKVLDIESGNNGVSVFTENNLFTSKIIIGADGMNSLVAKKLASIEKDKHSQCIGIRGYFENVKGFHQGNYIELHFYNEILPGYIWLFPMAGNKANVGVGMMADDISKRKINLKSLLEDFISKHPNIAPRFSNATLSGRFEAWRIPLGTKKRKISGERFLLAGDAACIVDPFTGEGIGNALRSGRVAADHIKACFGKNRFDEDFNAAYDKEIYRRMWKELRLSYSIQKLFRHPQLINYTVKKANRNEHFKSLIADAMTNEDIKKRLVRPYMFYKTFLR